LGKTTKKVKPPFAQNIQERRRLLGWNAHTLAEKAGIPYPTLRDIEAGYNAGREETKSAIAKALSCSLADLYQEPNQEAHQLPDVRGAAELLAKFQAAPREIQNLVLGILYKDEAYLVRSPAEFRQNAIKLLKAASSR
jgi:transcriptional regulator with XRE-family HTH domain